MTKNMWKTSFYSLVLLLAFLCISCEKKRPTQLSTLRINFQEGDLPSLHPHDLMIYLRGISISKTLFEGLTRIDPSGKPQLAGAESVEISPDGMRYTFSLRKNQWSDGTFVTASQYVGAWKAALSPTSSCTRASLLYAIKNGLEAKKGLVSLEEVGVHALNDQTLIVDLAHPFPYLLELLAAPICYPLQNPEKKELSAYNGPFHVSSWIRGQKLQLKPNPHFWNQDKVHLQEIEVTMMQDMTTVFNSYENQTLDWIGVPLCNLTAEQILQLQKTGKLLSHPVDRVFWVFLNTEHKALQSPKIRKALSMAIDRKKISEHILFSGEPLLKPFPESLLSFSPVHTLMQNIEEAKKLFAEGLKDLGLTCGEFPPFAISYGQQANRKQVAEYLSQIWSHTFQIQVKLDSQEWNVLRANIDKGLFEATGCMEAAFYNDPMEVLERFASRNPGNFSQWSHEGYTQKILAAKKENHLSERMKLLGEAEEILIDQMPFIPICADKFVFAHPPGFKGYVFDYVGALDFSYAEIETKPNI